jgi:hypothetical protein
MFDVLVSRVAAVDEHLVDAFAVARLDLIEHGLGLVGIRARRADLDSHHDLALGRGRKLHVVGGAKASIGPLHHPRLRVRGRGPPGLGLLGMLAGLLLQPRQRLLHPREPVLRRPLPCRLLPP